MNYERPEAGEPAYIQVGGRKLELRYTLKTLKALDHEHKISVLRGEGMAGAFQDPAKLGIILFYGLRGKNPDITQDWVEDNVDASMLIGMAPMLVYATTGSWPDMGRLASKNATSPMESAPQTGSPSGPLDATTSGALN